MPVREQLGQYTFGSQRFQASIMGKELIIMNNGISITFDDYINTNHEDEVMKAQGRLQQN